MTPNISTSVDVNIRTVKCCTANTYTESEYFMFCSIIAIGALIMFARTLPCGRKIISRFSLSRMTLLYSPFRLEVTLENCLYCYFCEVAMTMMLIHLSKCVTLVYNRIDCELSLVIFLSR